MQRSLTTCKYCRTPGLIWVHSPGRTTLYHVNPETHEPAQPHACIFRKYRLPRGKTT